MTIRKIITRMADGRELIYFDDANSQLPEQRKTDYRQPEARPKIAELRFDPLTSEWVANASHRQQRAFLPPKNSCPLCPSTEDFLSEIPDNFDVAVFENRSPAFGPESSVQAEVAAKIFGHSTLASGRCEVVVFSPQHQGSLAALGTTRMRTVIEAWVDRTAELMALEGVVQVFPFENRGEEIGVTLHHPHGQIYAYPFVTPKTQALLRSMENYGNDFFKDLLRFEMGEPRVVLETESFVFYVPYAARWPIELHMLPKRQISDLTELREAEKIELSESYGKVLLGLDRLYDTPTPYISAWHQAPKVEDRENIRLQLQISSPRRAKDKLKFLAGSESAMGAFIGDIAPEDAAAALREAIRD